MNAKTALIADIQRASFHDGEGIRTTVFFKGCPLSCAWCHNPECINPVPEELFYPEKCIGCGKCKEGCFSGARVICGKTYTVDGLMKEVLADRPYYENGGGVTFSGGEPFMQADFLSDAIDAARAEGISVAAETSLVIYREDILKKLDFLMADVKIFDSEIHRAFCGVPNEKIIENLKRANEIGIPITVRTPLIPGVEQGIDKISALLRPLSNVVRYEILPYHPMGLAKAEALGKPQRRFDIPDKATREKWNAYAFVR